jgi:hypothetical protein
MQQQHQHLRLL